MSTTLAVRKARARKDMGDRVGELVRGYMASGAIIAAAELDVFTALRDHPADAAELARLLGCDQRAMTILLDALASQELLEKRDGVYHESSEVAASLAEGGANSYLSITRHHGECMRKFAQLAEVVRIGRRAKDIPSIRGEGDNLSSFILGMDEVSRPLVQGMLSALRPIRFNHLLDIGGASGTWTIAFLRQRPRVRATLFDLPEVIELARDRLSREGLSDRVELVGGDFDTDPLPGGADLAWLSAITHMSSPRENTALYRKILAALQPGGRLVIRDTVMDPSHVEPAFGAMFAVNMLVQTPGGGTYDFGQYADDLAEAGFADVSLLRQGREMDSLIVAVKPG